MVSMEEQRIFIEPDDEITDVIDKLEKTKKEIAVLIIPKSAIILQSIINLKLLKRRADDLGKRLAVVTDSGRGRKLAEKIGLSVYRKAKVDKITRTEEKKKAVDETRERFPLALGRPTKEERPRKPKEPKRASKWGRRILAGVIIALFLASGTLAYFFLPKAVVRIKLESKVQRESFPLKVIETGDPEKGQVAGELVAVTARVSGKFDASGKKQVGGRASGRITVSNYWSSEGQPMVAATRFVHSLTGKMFRSTEAVTIPGTRVVEGQTVPGTATVSIQASGVGDSYNVNAGRFTIPGLPTGKQSKIYGQSDSGLTGGFQKEILVVSQDDYQQAKESLEKELKQKLDSKFAEEVAGKTVLEKKVEGETKESISPGIGEEAGSFSFAIQKRVTTMVYREEEFLIVVKEKFDREISEDRELVLEGLADRITVKKTKIDLKKKEALLDLDIKGQTIPKLDGEILKKNLVNREESDGEKYLIGYSQIQDADIELWPFWVRYVPTKLSRVTIDTSYE